MRILLYLSIRQGPAMPSPGLWCPICCLARLHWRGLHSLVPHTLLR